MLPLLLIHLSTRACMHSHVSYSGLSGKCFCAPPLSSRVALPCVAPLAPGEGSICELCVALVESLALFCIYLLQARSAFSRPRVLKGTNSKQPGDGITFHNGCTVYCCFRLGLMRAAPSHMKAHPLLLLGITNGYIGRNMFKPTRGFLSFKKFRS